MLCQVDSAQAMLPAMPDIKSAPELRVRALVHFLRNDVDESLTAFKKMISATPANKGRSKYLGEIAGIIYCMALAKKGGAANAKLIDRQHNAANKRHSNEPHALAFLLLHQYRQVCDGQLTPNDLYPLYSPPDNQYPWNLLVYCLVRYWLELTVSVDCREALKNRAMESREFLPWYTKEVEALLPLLEDGSLTPPEGSLAAFMTRESHWERALTALASLAPTAISSSATDESENRIAWILTREHKHIEVSAREQKRLKNGWTKGRPISLSRLVDDDALLQKILTDHDQKIVRSIRQFSNYYGRNQLYLPAGSALAAAVGHPAIFWKDNMDHALEINRCSPELMVREEKENVIISMHPVPETDEVAEPGEHLVERPGAIDVYLFNESHQRIAQILNGELIVPARARDRVLESIVSISPLLTVHSDLSDFGAASAEMMSADNRLYIQILPTGDKLRFDIGVQPFGTGPRFLPGIGGESVFTEIEGKKVQTRRDLTAERKAQEALLSACPDLCEEQTGSWSFSDLTQSLEGLLIVRGLDPEPVLSWPEGKPMKLYEESNSSSVSMSLRQKGNWFQVEGELSYGENDVLNLTKLLALIDHSSRFIRLGDNEFVTLTEELARRLQRLKALDTKDGIHRIAGVHLDEVVDGIELKADDAWEKFRKTLRRATETEAEVPATLEADLRDYQVEGYRWLHRLSTWGAGACLADDMGLGKTLQSLALIVSRASQGPTLVLAPTSVCANWLDETIKFAPTLNPILFGSAGTDRGAQLTSLGPFDLLICSYGLNTTEAERLNAVSWHTIVADEAQFFKNANTQRSKAVMKLEAPFRMITTGTPIENHLGELWNLFNFINPGLLGNATSFSKRFARPIEAGNAEASRDLKDLIRPFVLRRLKRDVLTELPPRTDITLNIELSEQEAALYEALRREATQSINTAETENQQRMIALAHITRLRQVVCNPNLVIPDSDLNSSKLARFAEIVEELRENKHRALVFSQFVKHLHLVRQLLDERGITYQYLDGSTKPVDRQKAVTAFQAGESDLFLISLKAGGTGLNLTAANYVIHMDPWWNPAVEDQASDRAHRLGQQQPVTVYRMVAANTIEQKIVELHARKRDLAEQLLEGTDMGARMTLNDMLALIS